jgi:hypothetical protein
LQTNISNPTPKTGETDLSNSVLVEPLTKLERVKTMVGDNDSVISEHSEGAEAEIESEAEGTVDLRLSLEKNFDGNPWIDGMVDPVSPTKSHFSFLCNPTEEPQIGTPRFAAMSMTSIPEPVQESVSKEKDRSGTYTVNFIYHPKYEGERKMVNSG